ncbi:MAG: hypothetical protein FJW30_22875 [Acidobacteria bacterium]|nr:hypothetical protein [Acidobacteriota bacterium]
MRSPHLEQGRAARTGGGPPGRRAANRQKTRPMAHGTATMANMIKSSNGPIERILPMVAGWTGTMA